VSRRFAEAWWKGWDRGKVELDADVRRILTARDVIHRLAASKTRTHEDELLIEDLEGAAGLPIAELAKLTDRWPPL
jgi:hypothetical protein